MKLEQSLTSYTKLNSKWIKDLNVRPDFIELLEEIIGRTLYDINQRKILFDPPPREMEIKRKINKWNLMKLKSFCTAKETIKKNEKTTPRTRRGPEAILRFCGQLPKKRVEKWSSGALQFTNLQSFK